MKSFLNACGFREPLRLIVEGPRAAEGGSRALPQPFAVIGRDARADVILDDLRVGRRHVYIQAVAGQVFWLDLESRTGTCDESGTRKWGWLAGGGLLQIGPFVIRRAAGDVGGGEPGPHKGNPTRESPLAVRGYGREPLPEVALEFLNGPSEATTWPMNRMMSLIGSAKGCKFRLTDPSVSAFHASLLRTPTGLWVVDLRGGRSISVNAEPVRFGPLADGDVLGIGRYRMRVRCRESRAGAPEPDRAGSIGLPAHRSRGDIVRRPVPEPAGGLAPAPPAYNGSMLPMPPPPFPVVASAAGVEVVSSSDAALLSVRSHTELSESALVPLVNQFSLMQQQMFDQFQQAMGMLVQMFGTMHREQMDVIREELDRLHELTRELQELKDELARSPGRAATPAVQPAGPVPPAMPAADPSPSPVAGAFARAPAAAATRPERPLAGAATPPPPPAGPRPDQARPGLGLPVTGGAAAPGDVPRDAVAWIHQRIAAIQQERESRWQKIVKLLPGMS
jgi:predicted component of type VI protein secretion system